ncbi:NUDIX domain-containing protein [Draconibacterium sp. IB214405]|uniref:NUDIX hydrolase n=1 Tax=Draconibacterium sp. IB214405 TaxID=3097352 RepID=UPI002A10B379|nr:NUDIX domain-containing protein [Draconibacterium sp. IB214405]MDX8338882.1 NUDIX domain-containing protein [Draconibacterium sp. IB214405]
MAANQHLKVSELLDHISLDCVIFGFHDNELKVLMLRLKSTKEYGLPGGFVKHDETLEQAAARTLKERTGLDNIFLKQFKVFSDPDRDKPQKPNPEFLKNEPPEVVAFFKKRFISVGYYALVEFSKVDPQPDILSESCEWISPFADVEMFIDHKNIIDKALTTLRIQLNQQPIGLKLLPRKFTMPQLQKLYETILGRELDRRNFQRKILSYKILNKLNERKTGGAHKAPFLYEFNRESYKQALEDGLSGVW